MIKNQHYQNNQHDKKWLLFGTLALLAWRRRLNHLWRTRRVSLVQGRKCFFAAKLPEVSQNTRPCFGTHGYKFLEHVFKRMGFDMSSKGIQLMSRLSSRDRLARSHRLTEMVLGSDLRWIGSENLTLIYCKYIIKYHWIIYLTQNLCPNFMITFVGQNP